jgi:hypothetical protein
MRTRTSLGFVAIFGLAACGGGGSSSPAPAPVMAQSVGGIWKTQYTVTSGPNSGDVINVAAIATETGEFYIAGRNANNGCAAVGFGQVSVNGASFSGSEEIAIVRFSTVPGVQTNCTYPDGTVSGTGTLTGTVAQRSSLSVTDTGTTSAGTSLGTNTTAWTFNPLYMQGSSFANIAGNYTDGSDTLSISSAGVISETDATTGCVITGQVTILNASYNAYPFSFTYSGCTGTSAAANGVTFTGLAALDTTVTPNQIDLGAHAVVSGQFVVIVATMPKQ